MMVQKERVVHCWVQKMVVMGVKGKMLLRQCGLMLCNIPCQKACFQHSITNAR